MASAGVIVAPETRDLDTLSDQLSGWLATHIDGASDVRVDSLDYPKGAGQSHETILFDAAWRAEGTEHRQGLVIRIKPIKHRVYVDDLFDEQYHLMRALHEDGRVRVAKTFWIEQDPAILGAPFFVMEKKSGRVPVSVPPYGSAGWVADATPAQRAKLWESGVRQLAAIQAVPREGLGFLRGATPGAEEGLAQEIDKYRRFIAWGAQDRPDHRRVLDAGLDRLEHVLPANRPAGLVWGDARLGNMMFDAVFEVTAVMDWEQPSLGGALHDLAWWLVLSELHHKATDARPWLEGMGSREETIALWHDVTGIATDDIEWYEEFTQLKMACCSLQTASLGRYPLATPATMATRLKVTVPGQ
jgi:aminoglycoside phosphotransferase (APT) family kinase protein